MVLTKGKGKKTQAIRRKKSESSDSASAECETTESSTEYETTESEGDFDPMSLIESYDANDTITNDKYAKFEEIWDKFAELCDAKNILAKKNWTCCSSCGHGDMHKLLASEENKGYIAYLFFHDQDRDMIYDSCKEDTGIAKVYLAWTYVWKDDEIMDPKLKKLARKIQTIAKRIGCKIEYENPSTRLLLKVNLNYEK